MLRGRRVRTFTVVVAALLLSLLAIGSSAVVEDTKTNHDDKFLGEVFQNPGSIDANKEQKAPRSRDWRFFGFPYDAPLRFECLNDVPMLHLDAEARDDTIGDVPFPSTCGRGTPMLYKTGDSSQDPTALYVLFWEQTAHGGQEDHEAGLVPAPKAEFKMVQKLLGILLETTWDLVTRGRMPEYLPFSDDTVVVYAPGLHALIEIGREDMELRQSAAGVDGKICALIPRSII